MVVSKDPMMSGGYNNENSPVVRKIKSNKLPVAIALIAAVCVLAKLFWPSQVCICIFLELAFLKASSHYSTKGSFESSVKR